MNKLSVGTQFDDLPIELQRQIFLQTAHEAQQKLAGIVKEQIRIIEKRQIYVDAISRQFRPLGDFFLYNDLSLNSLFPILTDNSSNNLNFFSIVLRHRFFINRRKKAEVFFLSMRNIFAIVKLFNLLRMDPWVLIA